MSLEMQDSLIQSIQIIAGERLNNVSFTKSYTGIVQGIDFENNKCQVSFYGDSHECIIPVNLSSFVDVSDIVIVQDIDGKGITRIVQGVISSVNEDKGMFHIYDPETDTIISSVLQLWDEELQMAINVVFELE
jgi:hypothetical protein